MDRRAFVGTALGGAVGVIAGGIPEARAGAPYLAGAGGGRALAEAIRVEGDRVRRRVEEAWRHDDPEGADPGARDILADVYAGVYGYGVVGELSMDDQVAPEVQELFQDSLATYARGMLALRDRLRAMDDEAWRGLEAAVAADPEAFDGVLGVLEGEVLASALPERARQRTSVVGRRVRWQVKRRGLRAPAEEWLGQVDRLERLARDCAERGDTRPIDALQDPEQLEALRRALRGAPARVQADDGGVGSPPATPRGPSTEVTEPRPAHGRFLVVMGALMLAVGVLAGTGWIVVGAALIWCPCVGIPLMLLGGTILWAGIYFGRRLIRSGRAHIKGEPPPGVLATWEIVPTLAWQSTGVTVEVGAYRRFRVRGSGRVWLAGAERPVRPRGLSDRAAGEGAPLPGSPWGGLVARVGATVLEVGTAADLPGGLLGLVDFAVNVPEADRVGAEGAFRVTVVVK